MWRCLSFPCTHRSKDAIWTPRHWSTAPPLVSLTCSAQSSSLVHHHQNLQPVLWKEPMVNHLHKTIGTKGPIATVHSSNKMTNNKCPKRFEVPPFPVLLCQLFEPLLALFILYGDKVPVVVNQKILGKILRTDAIHLKQINPKQSNFKQEGFSNTLMPIVSPSLRWNGTPSSDSAFFFFFFLESCWLWK